jgi:hypothetical protein
LEKEGGMITIGIVSAEIAGELGPATQRFMDGLLETMGFALKCKG